MDHSHFADASGVDPGVGVHRLGPAQGGGPRHGRSHLRRPWCSMSSVTLPVAGTISTYTPLLGVQGVIGVKSGFTTAAGGGDVLAVDAHRARQVRCSLLAAVTGQTGPVVLAQAGLHALALVDAVSPAHRLRPRCSRSDQVVAHVGEAGTTTAAATIVVRLHAHLARGQRHQGLRAGTPRGVMQARRGTRVGTRGRHARHPAGRRAGPADAGTSRPSRCFSACSDRLA